MLDLSLKTKKYFLIRPLLPSSSSSYFFGGSIRFIWGITPPALLPTANLPGVSSLSSHSSSTSESSASASPSIPFLLPSFPFRISFSQLPYSSFSLPSLVHPPSLSSVSHPIIAQFIQLLSQFYFFWSLLSQHFSFLILLSMAKDSLLYFLLLSFYDLSRPLSPPFVCCHLDNVIYEQAIEIAIKAYFANHNHTLGSTFWAFLISLKLLG